MSHGDLNMNNNITTVSFVSVLMVMFLIAGSQAVSAGVEAECRQEAEDYGIMPELRDEYISGCIDSRGGVSVSVSAEDDLVQPAGSNDGSNLEAGDQNPAE